MATDDPAFPDDHGERALRQLAENTHNFIKVRSGALSTLLDLPQPDSPDLVSDHERNNVIARRAVVTDTYRPPTKRTRAPTASKIPLYVPERDFIRPRAKLYFPSPVVSPTAKDYARVLHSPAFRRLQGKTQLIPAGESEFVRTRLTHSLEVADIAVRIAKHINYEHPYFRRNHIDTDLVATASLCHDLGHAPFGHSGEVALNEKMLEFGGFEGNAQTIRIITRLESRFGAGLHADPDIRVGLNLTYRCIGATIKYDQRIDHATCGEGGIRKGYYTDDEETVIETRQHLRGDREKKLATIECQIMDLADDIAYSTYDLEDTMAAGIMTPFDYISQEDNVVDRIASHVNQKLNLTPTITSGDVVILLASVFRNIFEYLGIYKMDRISDRIVYIGRSYNEAMTYAHDAERRRRLMETIIEGTIRSINVDLNGDEPMMSVVNMDAENRLSIECMKALNFIKVIDSANLRTFHHKSQEVISYLFTKMQEDGRGSLMREPFRRWFEDAKRRDAGEPNGGRHSARVICDNIASMTDAEALSLYRKLRSTDRESIFGA